MTTSVAAPILAELGFIVLAVVMFYAGTKRYGAYRTGLFLAGAILWTAILENFAVLQGGYTYYSYADQLLLHYPGYLFWVGTVPLWILLGWFVFAMAAYIIFSDLLLPNRRIVVQAAAAGLFALNIDLMMDPAAVANNLWVWLSGSFRLLTVPLFNWVGWFLLIFFYYIIAQKTIFSNQPMPVLSEVETRIFGGGRMEGGDPDLRRFAFRVVVVEVFVIVVLYSLSSFLDFLAGLGV